MEIINPYKEFKEIKICRLCGTDNRENIDIFSSKPISSRSEDLLTKILTVYPLVLYKDDPLPQHICPKCIGNVSTTYQDIQQVLKQQNKWLNLTKAVQPEHKYFHILNVVEDSTQSAMETIKTLYNIELNNLPITKLLATPTKENHSSTANNTNSTVNINENVVQNIQSKLESKGFTIKRIKVPSINSINQDISSVTDLEPSTGNSFEPNSNIVTCNYCNQKFSDINILAQHQLVHLKVSANKIFQKHLLPKQLRRGRLITLNDNKCIRCLNCWRIFKDNKAILQHWSGGECEFYCSVCDKEFPHSPKMLREHVTVVHGISHRSVTRQFMSCNSGQLKPLAFTETTLKLTNPNPLSTKLKSGFVTKTGYKKPPPKSCTKNEDGTITCKVCHKVFDNFRSSNSHMRKHKPPQNRFGPSVPRVDHYNAQDEFMGQPSTSQFRYNHNNPSSSTHTNSMHIKPPRPAYRIIMKNGPLRGIKTKIVQKRHDFLTNYGNNIHHPTPKSLTSTTEMESDNENMIVPELLMPTMKLEHNDSHNFSPTIKSEPLDNLDDGEMQEPRLCFICNESFSSTRDYELHAMFVHNIN